MTKSDHRPLIVDTEDQAARDNFERRGVKRFEARWLKEETVEEMVKAAWARAAARGEGPTLMQKTAQVHDELHVWDREVLKGPTNRIRKMQKDLEKLRRGPMSDESVAAQKELLVRLELLMEQEELMWVQRARANWLKHGDRNTKFFQQFASSRKKKNTVTGLVDDQGTRHEDGYTMCSMVQNYFSYLFQSEFPMMDQSVLDAVEEKVTADMNRSLLADFTPEEVKKALFAIGDLKAPGPDGLHAIFYKRFWNMLGDDLVREVLHAVNTATIPDGWNDTTIVMIPKVDNPDRVAQFRPISLCNVVYKVISKMLSNRMKAILPDVISGHQSAFVPGRLITDNILIAYECIHAIKRKKGKKGLCAVKLDMHKAYDRVEWVFLEKIMLKLGFNARWVKLIMACVFC
jgi:hypothetical protein